MFKVLCTVATLWLFAIVCSAEPPRSRLRFPEPAINRPLPFLAHQEVEPPAPAEAAPYPPAGLKPEPPFELPDQTYGPPDQTYGPPDQTYGPPDQTYGPPDQTYGPPDQTYGPPVQPAPTYGAPPPAPTYGPPGTPAEEYGPPPPSPGNDNGIPQTASIIDPRDIFPRSLLTLPRVERLVAFRPRRRPVPSALRRPANQPRPEKLRSARPQPQAAKLILRFNH